MTKLTALVLLILCSLEGTVLGAHTRARLIIGANTARPGETVLSGVELTMDKGWHTYWRNSGASGMPTTIEWQLPPGVTAGEIHWPLPEKLPEGDLTTYVYSDRVVLLVPLTLSTNLAPGIYQIKGKVDWLECESACIPGDATVQASLSVGNDAKPSTDNALLAEWMQKVPVPYPGASAEARWGKTLEDGTRELLISWKPKTAGNLREPDFYPYSSDTFEIQPATKILAAKGQKVELQKVVKKLSGNWPDSVTGVVVEKAASGKTGIEVALPLGTQPAQKTQALWLMILYAFVGGLILNIMPCVLPVISLKILGFVNHAKENPAKVRQLGLIYAAGVLFSFLVLAGLVIGIKSAGQAAGWGMQFGNPIFLVLLTSLITLVALNLFGVFEITPGTRVMDAAGTLASRQGAAGAFFNGVLATVLATPCTAPFLGAALGFAFLQPAHITVLIFSVVAIGLASPYVILTWNPGLMRRLPKPGRWMERFKIAMGFPMLATAVWLFSLLTTHYGSRAWWMVMFLVVLGVSAWVFGEFVQRGRAHKPLSVSIAVVLVLLGYWLVLERELDWRNPAAAASPGIRTSESGIPWQPWSAEAVEQARKEGKPVLVDFTADWCLTCQVNKKVAIEIPQVRDKLKEIGAVALLGDYTRLPAAITAELNRYGRAGVPLVLVFPKDATKEPLVLPEALTPGIVLNALTKAAN